MRAHTPECGNSTVTFRDRGQLCPETVRSFLWPHGEISVELEAWGGEGLSAGELVRPGREEASSASGSCAAVGHGGQKVGDDDQAPGDDDSVVEEVGTQLDFEELSLGLGGASGLLLQRSFYVL